MIKLDVVNLYKTHINKKTDIKTKVKKQLKKGAQITHFPLLQSRNRFRTCTALNMMAMYSLYIAKVSDELICCRFKHNRNLGLFKQHVFFLGISFPLN